ncbi:MULTISPECIES: hypothetical protein [Pseudomonas]|uniref:Uncharacterized protein n=1 Tax=Pseudomonas mosselii TaxID=78327 RepID=A0A5R8Z5Y2_9PSED|nr:hypothetical protein [Pseudomonas mosselii]TLP61153.1 hypothetical protein FEM01_11225 [Pseudomonas mosselii]
MGWLYKFNVLWSGDDWRVAPVVMGRFYGSEKVLVPVLLYSLAIMTNLFSMMVLTIVLSVFGQSELAAEVGLVHGATVALFYSFSGNARSLILSESNVPWAARVLRLRLWLLLPLCLLAWVACVGGTQGGAAFIALLILRRASEWLAEVFLSERECCSERGSAFSFIACQCLTLVGVSLAIVLDVAVTAAMFVWACSPLLSCLGSDLLRQAFTRDASLSGSLRGLLPHFGSTLAIGVSVYVFRLFIILLVGKQVAGDFFAAFALGGIMGSVFAQALGPTMVRNERALLNGRFIRFFNILLMTVFLAGAGLALVLWWVPDLLAWTAKSDLFWMAVSCSLVGGAVMVLAQRVRLQWLQAHEGRDVFSSDVLANMLLVGCVPLLFLAGGEAALVSLYLIGAILSLAFYLSEDWFVALGKVGGARLSTRLADVCARKQVVRGVMILLVLGLFTPMFIQLGGGIYQGGLYQDSGSQLMSVPVPVSVVFCYLGVLLVGRYAQARRVLVVVFFTFIGMWVSVLSLAENFESGSQVGKLLLLVQYVLPMFALVLGVQVGSAKDALQCLALGLLAVLLVVATLQVVATLSSSQRILSHSAMFFSVYQNLQYVPVVFAGGYLISLYALWSKTSLYGWLLVLGGLMGLYVALSFSMLALVLLPVGVLIFIAVNFLLGIDYLRSLLLGILVAVGMALGLSHAAGSKLFAVKYNLLPPVAELAPAAPVAQAPLPPQASIPPNVQERLKYWTFYYIGVSESWRAFLLGHEHPPERKSYPSAHNYYLDFVYNFGFLALLPLLTLMLYTLHGVWKNRRGIFAEPGVLAVVGVLLFTLLVDNSFKVGMRQPYPGIVSFFLWGMLLAWLWRLTQAPGSHVDRPAWRYAWGYRG